ncbi:efflux RND transporter periplasmic adaptor subunit [Desulfobacter sp.]|uniref:efflux RND transporter periplasmic adaptor subunit n=1 Tax=Desulfobacter sp. TaxID=2294 RepID=UPI003D0B0A21
MSETQEHLAESAHAAESLGGKERSMPEKNKNLRAGGFSRWAFVIVAVLIVLCLHVPSNQKVAVAAAPAAAAGTPKVVVETVESGPASPPLEFIGHIEAIQSVDLRAEVVGRIDTVHFEEGAMVKVGDLLFTIRQPPYRARMNAAKASLAKAKADLMRAEKLLSRLTSADPRSVVQTDLDTAESAVLQGRAIVQQARAELELAEIDLEYTEIRAPISGKIGKALFTKGNYVGPATGTLAQLVQMNPVRVVYSMSDREYLQQLKSTLRNQSAQVELGLKLPDGTAYSGRGVRDFVNNSMDTGTGTIALWDKYINPDGILVPGTYVTAIITGRQTATAALIPQEAVLSDDQGYFTYTVNKENIVDKRRLELGGTIGDRFSVQAGLEPGENVVVKGIQRIGHAGQQVHAVVVSSTKKE